MKSFRAWVLILFLVVIANAQIPAERPLPPASCPVTAPPQKPFIPPKPFPTETSERSFWLGTDKLWTNVQKSAVWGWGPNKPGHENDLTAKTFWMSVNFRYDKEYPPALKVSGRKLDGPSTPLRTLTPTNAFPGPTAAMLSGVIVPTPGCWEITGEYRGQRLSFVVWVTQLDHGAQ